MGLSRLKYFLQRIKYFLLSKICIGNKRKHYILKLNYEYGKIINHGKNNTIIIHRKNGNVLKNLIIKGCTIEFFGNNSTFIIHEPCKCINCYFAMGDNNTISLKSTKFSILNLRVPYKMAPQSKLLIGNDFSVCGCEIYMHDEENTSVTIGNDCMLSFGIIIWPSDGHAIEDTSTGNLINYGENITIEDHVWIGMHTTILKGSIIPKNSILAAKSLYTKKSNKLSSNEGVIFAGIPAKVIKKHIKWHREHCTEIEKRKTKILFHKSKQ